MTGRTILSSSSLLDDNDDDVVVVREPRCIDIDWDIDIDCSPSWD